MSVATIDVYCHCRCLFIVIPYNRINLNHDRINLNLVGAPRADQCLLMIGVMRETRSRDKETF